MEQDFSRWFRFSRDAVLVLRDGAVLYRSPAAEKLPAETLFPAVLDALSRAEETGFAESAAVTVLDYDAVFSRAEPYVLCTLQPPAEQAGGDAAPGMLAAAFADARNALSILSLLTASIPLELEAAHSPNTDRYAALLRKCYYSLRRKVGNLDGLLNGLPETGPASVLDLAALCRELVGVTNMLLGTEAVRAETPETAVWIRGSAEALRQLVLNLLSNSLKYTPEGGEILLRCTQTDSRAILSVLDNGRGIPEETLSRLFRSYTSPPDLSDGKAGSGVGLYLANRIARRFGGAIVAESRPGRGTRVTVSFPLAEESGRLKAAVPAADPLPDVLTELADCLPLSAYTQKFSD